MKSGNATGAEKNKNHLRKDGFWLLIASSLFFLYALIRLSAIDTTAGWLTALNSWGTLPFVFIMLCLGHMIQRYRQDRSFTWTAQYAIAAIISLSLLVLTEWQWANLTEHAIALTVALLGALATAIPFTVLASMKLVQSRD